MILNDVVKEWRPPCFYTETELRCMLNKVNTDSNVPPASCLDSFLGMFYTDRGIRSVAQQTWWRSNLPLSQQKQPMMENIPLKWSSCRSRRTLPHLPRWSEPTTPSPSVRCRCERPAICRSRWRWSWMMRRVQGGRPITLTTHTHTQTHAETSHSREYSVIWYRPGWGPVNDPVVKRVAC